MYKFTGFTEKANRALNSAIEVAENLGHTYIGSEHLLAGLVREDNGAATKLLAQKGVTSANVDTLIRQTVGVGIPTVLTPDVPPAPAMWAPSTCCFPCCRKATAAGAIFCSSWACPCRCS